MWPYTWLVFADIALSCQKKDSPLSMEAGGSAVEVIQALLQSTCSNRAHADRRGQKIAMARWSAAGFFCAQLADYPIHFVWMSCLDVKNSWTKLQFLSRVKQRTHRYLNWSHIYYMKAHIHFRMETYWKMVLALFRSAYCILLLRYYTINCARNYILNSEVE